MRPIKIVTDSCSDLTKELRDKYSIEYVKMNTVHNEKETPASLDWEYYSAKELYDLIRNGERVTTTQVPAQEFSQMFTKLAEEGYDVIYISCPGVLSGSVNTGSMVAKDIMEKYPEAKIVCVDPKAPCMGEGMIVIKAAELVAEGKSLDEILAYIEENKLRMNQFCTVNTLDYLKRAGRVKASSAFFGNLFGVKPIIISDINGQNTAIKKVKGRLASMDEIVNLLADAMQGEEDRRVFVGHADCPQEEVDYVVNKVKEVVGTEEIFVDYIGPIIGASVGPGAMVVYGWGKKVELEG
ncbi:MAG: DegV family protein [Ruminococcus sp.]|nr:DegV family protein [Ruminococcus sp.]